MKKIVCTAILFILAHSVLTAQTDQGLGYKTIDIGGELNGSPLQMTAGLHFAYNFPFHHGINLRLQYHKTDYKDKGVHETEKGTGLGFTLGYRYYFRLRPHGFFLGARHDLSRMETDWKQGLISGNTVTWTSQPALELGYMALINDQLFITPAVSAGYQFHLQTKGEAIREGSLFSGGISIGYKF